MGPRAGVNDRGAAALGAIPVVATSTSPRVPTRQFARTMSPELELTSVACAALACMAASCDLRSLFSACKNRDRRTRLFSREHIPHRTLPPEIRAPAPHTQRATHLQALQHGGGLRRRQQPLAATGAVGVLVPTVHVVVVVTMAVLSTCTRSSHSRATTEAQKPAHAASGTLPHAAGAQRRSAAAPRRASSASVAHRGACGCCAAAPPPPRASPPPPQPPSRTATARPWSLTEPAAACFRRPAAAAARARRGRSRGRWRRRWWWSGWRRALRPRRLHAARCDIACSWGLGSAQNV